jgi:hypothetical protein
MTQENGGHLPNWTGLLGWSTRYHDGTAPSQFGPMDPERRAWLEKALNTAFEGTEDPNKIMARAVVELQEGRLSAGFDMLEHVSDFPDCVENIDILGALKEVVSLLNSHDGLVVKRSAEILNMYLPNNPKIQIAAEVKYGCLKALRTAVQANSSDKQILSACLSATANLVRNVETLENNFIKNDGVKLFCDSCRENMTPSIVQKVCGLLYSIGQRHDLSAHGQCIQDLILAIYLNPTLAKTSIQMFETVANLASLQTLSADLREALLDRRRWIQSLTSEGKTDFEPELLILNRNL